MTLIRPESKKTSDSLSELQKSIWCLLACVLLVAGCAGTNKNDVISADTIGEADISSDGTITLQLRGVSVVDGKQVAGDTSIVYKTSDPNYKAILKHLGGMHPGESKSVKPWPDPARGDDIDGGYNRQMFLKALKDTSSSPLYVLISAGRNKSSTKEVCVPAPFLLGAIHIENQLPYDDKGEREALRLAQMTKQDEFIFSNPKALENISSRYTGSQRVEVSAALSKYSRAELAGQLHDQGSVLQKLYLQHHKQLQYSYRDAVACALLKRGILVGVEDLTGQLFVP